MRGKFTLRPCTRKNLCIDCDDLECLQAGEAVADCPKWKCDNEIGDCFSCEFLKEYQEKMRAEYQKGVTQ